MAEDPLDTAAEPGMAEEVAQTPLNGVEARADGDEPGNTSAIDITDRSDDRSGEPDGERGGSARRVLDEPGSPTLSTALEAVLLVVDEPVPARTLAQVLQRPVPEVEQVLAGLAADYQAAGRGFELRCVAGGWRLYTHPSCAAVVEHFVLDGQQARLTQAALETLTVIAYRQPVSRSRVSAVRGVNVDGVIRTLLGRGLIEECGSEPESGALLYRTTSVFLERLGLGSLEELPELAPLIPDLESLDMESHLL